ncbi:hypothetical protein D3C73_1219960 [compost metagenome]
MAFYIKGAILSREGLASLTHTAQQRLEVMPQFAPVLLAWTPQCVGMLAANGRRIGVIVKRSKGLTPEQHELRLGRQQCSHYRLQVGRPCFRRAERRVAPVHRLQQCADGTAIEQEV